jgi:ketosteroid isomerase-like protein/DNA-binding phage protein
VECERRLKDLYDAFNDRDIDVVLAQMATDVRWPNAWEGGWIQGHDGVRDYWTRQWASIKPRVEPIGFLARGDGCMAVEVHQLVSDLNGEVLDEGSVVHLYSFRDGLIVRMEVLRLPAVQRRLLVATIRDTVEWRIRMVDKFGDDFEARKRSLRAMQALRTLANFVEGMSDEDPELWLHALHRVEERDGLLQLVSASRAALSRFGLQRGAWQTSSQTQPQMRKILRRINGIEAQKRHLLKQGEGFSQ